MARRPIAHTYSVVARDSRTGDLGVGVQSHYFSVGADVPWAEAGVGGVATQATLEISYGPRGLDLMRKGIPAPEALAELVAGDPKRDVRQVAMIDAAGRAAAHTGAKCIPSAGHVVGPGWSVQANMMLTDDVVPAMARQVRRAAGDLAERLLRTLEAAEAAGGDIRGAQSAAMLIVKGSVPARPWEGRVLELRVEDHKRPLVELRRLVTLHRAYAQMSEADSALRSRDDRRAFAAFRAGARGVGGNPEIEFWMAIELAKRHRWGEAATILRKVFAKDRHWRDLVGRLPAADELTERQASDLLRHVDRTRKPR
ncbi:MAG: DUF1028 domain-containing protein [Methanobacteriota archaeon]